MSLSHLDEQRGLIRRAGVVCALVLGLLISVDAGRASAETLQLAFFGSTSDVTLESGSFGRTRLRIPRAYYMGGTTGAIFKSHGVIMLEMALPDMRPRKTDVPLRGEKGSPEWLESLAENRAGLRVKIGPRESSKNYFESQSRLFRSAYTKREDSHFGLTLYVRESCGQKKQETQATETTKCYVASQEYFLSPPFPDGNAVRFNCIPENVSGDLNGCTAWTPMGRLDLEYSLRRSELYRWREIDQAVRGFVQKLIVE